MRKILSYATTPVLWHLMSKIRTPKWSLNSVVAGQWTARRARSAPCCTSSWARSRQICANAVGGSRRRRRASGRRSTTVCITTAPSDKLLAANPPVSCLFASQANSPRAVERLVDRTGSRLDARGVDLYRRLISFPGHVAATLRMMATWDQEPLERDLPTILHPREPLVADRDGRTSPPQGRRRPGLGPVV